MWFCLDPTGRHAIPWMSIMRVHGSCVGALQPAHRTGWASPNRNVPWADVFTAFIRPLWESLILLHVEG